MESKKPRFVMVPMYIAENPEISFAAKVVYLAIKSHLPKPFPSLNRIVRMTGSSRRTVIRAIKELEKMRVLNKRRRAGKSNEYAISARPKQFSTEAFMEEIKKGPVANLAPTSSSNGTTTSSSFGTLSITSETISTKLDGY